MATNSSKSFLKGSTGAVTRLFRFFLPDNLRPIKEANMKLRLALVAVILAGGAPVGAWADDYQFSCNLNASVVNHIQTQLHFRPS
jgi:hypothetical protein